MEGTDTPLIQAHDGGEFATGFDDIFEMLMTVWQCPACATLTRLIDLPPDDATGFACPVCGATVAGEVDL